MSIRPWWTSAVIYQIYVRSWKDSDGDGVGDLGGIIEKLDYLAWLGIDGIWLSPIMPSPNADFGYDISDYYGIDPAIGSKEEFALLIGAAASRGIAILLDLVPNHTSVSHPWFVSARGDPASTSRNYYIWAPPGTSGAPPNNWQDVTGGSAWQFEPETGLYYLHSFMPSQPDLNWHNPDVRREFENILRYWFNQGVAGFRIDSALSLVKDSLLRDDPPISPEEVIALGGESAYPDYEVFSTNRPEVHDIYRSWRIIADNYIPPRLLLGETWVCHIPTLASYYGDGQDELGLAFNFSFIFSPFTAPALAQVVQETLEALPDGATPVWTASNHDISRFPTRWCDGDIRRVRLALFSMLMLPGSTVIYYGDEIGMVDVEIPEDSVRDVMRSSVDETRDRVRTPMQWEPGEGAGFTDPGVTPWLPIGDTTCINVESSRSDSFSVLHLFRELLSIRHSLDGLMSGIYRQILVTDSLWIWYRGERYIVMTNFSEESISLGAIVELTLSTSQAGVSGDIALESTTMESTLVRAVVSKDTASQRTVPGGTTSQDAISHSILYEGIVVGATDLRLIGTRLAALGELAPWQGIVVEIHG